MKQYQLDRNRSYKFKRLTKEEEKQLEEIFREREKILIANRNLAQENSTLRKRIKIQTVKKKSKQFSKMVKNLSIGVGLFVPPVVVIAGYWLLNRPERFYERYFVTGGMVYMLYWVWKFYANLIKVKK